MMFCNVKAPSTQQTTQTIYAKPSHNLENNTNYPKPLITTSSIRWNISGWQHATYLVRQNITGVVELIALEALQFGGTTLLLVRSIIYLRLSQ